MSRIHRRRVADLRTLARCVAALAMIGCPGAGAPEPQRVAEPATSCAERLAPLREEVRWADESQSFDWRLVEVPDWQRITVPTHVLRWQFREISLDDAHVLSFEDTDEAVAAWRRESPFADENEIRLDLERTLERDAEAALKAKLAGFPASSVALAIESTARWEHVAPVLRAMSQRDSTVRLVVDFAAPPWWQMRLFDEATRNAEDFSDMNHVLALRAAEVFATCPTAVWFANGGPRKLEDYVDGIEACDCSVDLAAARELVHAIGRPMLGSAGVVEISFVRSGVGAPFVAERSATWAEVLPRLRAGSGPVVLPDVPPPPEPPPPLPPPERRKRRG